MDSIFGDVTKQALSLLYKETRSKKNQKKITYVIDTLVSIAIQRIQPYLYAIMAVLVIIFLMNCFQFFYYVKLFLYITNANTILPRQLGDMSSLFK
jgi:hypothetical protein